MELDDLKQTWKQTPIKKNKNTDIMEMIQHKSYGPVTALKNAFRKEIVLMALLPFLLLATNANDISKPLISVMYWCYVAFCITMIVLSIRNYLTVSKWDRMDGMVRANLEQQINILEMRLRWNIIGTRITMLFFIALTEIMPYFQHFRMLDKWHSLSPYIRFGSYAALLILQYFTTKTVTRRKYGNHLEYLKRLVKELE